MAQQRGGEKIIILTRFFPHLKMRTFTCLARFYYKIFIAFGIICYMFVISRTLQTYIDVCVCVCNVICTSYAYESLNGICIDT